MNRIIEDFSYLRKTNCKGVYLDNAATTLCPDEVIDYMSEMQKYNFVNINRGSYKLAESHHLVLYYPLRNISQQY